MLPVATFAAPVILYTDIVSGPNTGGENNNGTYLSIFGKGFGTAKGPNDKVTINGIEVAAYKQWGAPSKVYDSHGIQVITVQPGPKITSGPIVVSVAGKSSNSNHRFSVHPGDIYFVATNGSNATGVAGDITRPFATPQYVYNLPEFGAGDQIVIRGGIYDGGGSGGNFLRLEKSGTNTAFINIIGYPGEDVRINNSANTCFRYYNGSGYTAISNFICDGLNSSTTQFLFSVTASPIGARIVNNESLGLRGTGGGSASIEGGTTHSAILGNKVHDNGITKLYHGIYIDNNSNNVEIAYNHVYNQTGGRGIQIYHGTGVQYNIVIHDNVVHDIALDGISFGNASTIGLKIYNNIIYRTGVPSLQTDSSGGGCIRINSTSAEVEIYNNVLYDCDIDDTSGSISLEKATSVVMANNIIYPITGDYYDQLIGVPSEIIKSTNNLWYGGATIPSWDINSINQNPLFIDPTSPARNFHLQSNSPAIDAGVNVPIQRDMDGTLRPQGTTFDIGAFEYCISDCPIADAMPPAKPKILSVK